MILLRYQHSALHINCQPASVLPAALQSVVQVPRIPGEIGSVQLAWGLPKIGPDNISLPFVYIRLAQLALAARQRGTRHSPVRPGSLSSRHLSPRTRDGQA